MSLGAADVEVLEAGCGPLVVLVHSSVAGARQWRKLSELLAPSYHVKAVQLFGYGRTPRWTHTHKQTLADQARLVQAVIPDDADDIALVGHSFGGGVAMTAAAGLGARVSRLVLFEPNPFDLLRQAGRNEAYAEIAGLRDAVTSFAAANDWPRAAELFADYWGGAGEWERMSADRRASFVASLEPNFHEWDAILEDTTTLPAWAERLPQRTTVIHDPNTVRPMREIVQLMRAGTRWQVIAIPRGGHMAPLTHPDLVNPIIAAALQR